MEDLLNIFPDLTIIVWVPVLVFLLILPGILILVVRNTMRARNQMREARENSDEQLRKIAAEYLKKADEEKPQKPD